VQIWKVGDRVNDHTTTPNYYQCEQINWICEPAPYPQHALTASPKMSPFSRLLYRNWNSATYSGRYLRLTLWNVPTMPRLISDQKPSMVAVTPTVGLLLRSHATQYAYEGSAVVIFRKAQARAAASAWRTLARV
jgi:hypothetical protein